MTDAIGSRGLRHRFFGDASYAILCLMQSAHALYQLAAYRVDGRSMNFSHSSFGSGAALIAGSVGGAGVLSRRRAVTASLRRPPALFMTSPARSHTAPRTPQHEQHGEKLFLELRPTIERILAVLARRHTLSADDADEFASWARARLVDNDFSILRKFEGRSLVQTYLSTVLANLFRDYRNSVWGRWRPSSEAQRLGPLAVRLETMLYRDRIPLRETVAQLRSSGCDADDAELARLAARLPSRTVELQLSLEDPSIPPSSLRAQRAATERITEAERESLSQALHDVLRVLPPEDRIILRMRFWDDVSVADIARALHTPQKPLYRRLERLHAHIRDGLKQRGFTRDLALDVFREVDAW